MKRIWMNHWFSTAYNIIRLIKQDDPDFYIIGSNTNYSSPIQLVCDEWYSEPVLDDDAYVEYCLEFCLTHSVDAFLPRRGMLPVSMNKHRFEEIGTLIMADDYTLISALNHKDSAYALFESQKIGNVPEYRVVTSVEEFCDSYVSLSEQYGQLCFKLARDEGGLSFHRIENNVNSTLFRTQNRLTFDAAINILKGKKSFPPIIMMPYLPDQEVSVDCLKTSSGIIMIPRIKSATRVERISYDKEILLTCRSIVEKNQLENPCNIQFKYLNGKPYILEVNTRMSGGIQMACVGSGINIPNIAVNKLFGINKGWKNSFEEKQVSYIEMPVVI